MSPLKRSIFVSQMYKYSVLGLFVMLLILSCGGNNLRTNLTSPERMDYALKLFKDGKYFDARTQFRIITLNSPGNLIIDQAQFYLAECHFGLKEYITSAAEYKKLQRLYPQSKYVDDAQYKIGLSYFKLSPKSNLDQKIYIQVY